MIPAVENNMRHVSTLHDLQPKLYFMGNPPTFWAGGLFWAKPTPSPGWGLLADLANRDQFNGGDFRSDEVLVHADFLILFLRLSFWPTLAGK